MEAFFYFFSGDWLKPAFLLDLWQQSLKNHRLINGIVVVRKIDEQGKH